MLTKIFPFFLFLLYIGVLKNASAQPFPQDYFRSPINEKIELAGNFGELRPNHFHTGIDIKICGIEGLPIYAAADGYVSRIGISPYGYGNALYIDHPNGYTTVYGHLYRYADNIAAFIRQKQYQNKSFALDFMVDKNKFPVKKGDIIAFGGNSGGSTGAHLHFEIRETKSEKPVNPLLFGFDIPDSVPPVIRSVKIYPMEKNSFVQVNFSNKKIIKGGEGQNIRLDAVKYKGNYYLRGVASIHASGPIGFSVQATDYMQGTHNTMGIYSIELCLNSQRRYFHKMQKLDFSLKRYINTHIDYAEKMLSRRWYEKSFIEGNNQLPIYEGLIDNGIIDVQPGKDYKMAYYLKDAEENLSALTFNIIADSFRNNVLSNSETDNYIQIPYNKNFTFDTLNFRVNIPENTLYNNIPLQYRNLPKPKSSYYSSIHDFCNEKIPVNDFFDVAIKPEFLPDRLQNKACIISRETGYLGGVFSDGWLKAQARTLGKFYVMTDTTPPAIVPGNIRTSGSNLWKSTGINFRISDNLSGIKSYNGYIDGKWVLFQYDYKHALIYYLFDEYCPPGKHTIEMEITDDKGNVRKWKGDFVR